MTRRELFGLLIFWPTRAAAAGVHITGQLDATEQEAQEGYFACGKELALVTHPHSPIYDALMRMRGTEVQISVFNP